VENLAAEMDVYDVAAACQQLRDYLELLTNWYIRRSRDRFWDGDADALDTLYTVLETVTRAAAPLLPMTAETIWRGLTGGESAHLTDWPSVEDWPADESLAATMDLTRSVCSAALSLRKNRQLRVRLPLSSLTVAEADAARLAEFADIIKDEVNVKDLVLSADPASLGATTLTVNPRTLGPRLGKQVQEVIKAVKAGDWSVSPDGDVTAGGVALQAGEYDLTLTAANPDSTLALPGTSGLISLDTSVTPELAAEGTARDVVRVIQQARKDAGLAVSDRITLSIGADAAVADAIRAHADFIAGETLATALQVLPAADVLSDPQPVGENGKVSVQVARVSLSERTVCVPCRRPACGLRQGTRHGQSLLRVGDVRPGNLPAPRGLRPLGERVVVPPVGAERGDDRQAPAVLLIQRGAARHRASPGQVPHEDKDAGVAVIAAAVQAQPHRRPHGCRGALWWPGAGSRRLDRVAHQFGDDNAGDIGEVAESPVPQHARRVPAGAPRRAREGRKLQGIVPRTAPRATARSVVVGRQRRRMHGSVSICPL